MTDSRIRDVLLSVPSTPRLRGPARFATLVALALPAAAQQLVGDLDTTPDADPSSMPRSMVASGGQVFFSAVARGVDRELFVSDGSVAGTRQVADINPLGPALVEPLAAAGGRTWLRADDGVHGAELWLSDGTARGTVMAVDLFPGAQSGLVARDAFVALPSGRSVFFATDGTQLQMWGSDGTAAGTERLTGLPTTFRTRVWMAATAREAVFTFPSLSLDIWRSDGTAANTAVLTTAPAFLWALAADRSRDEVLYLAGSDLHVVDRAGNDRVLAMLPGTGTEILPLGNLVFVAGDTSLQVVDRSTGGVVALPASNPSRMFAFGAQVIFQAYDQMAGIEPWISDGSTAGTRLLADLLPGVSGSSLTEVVDLGNGRAVLSHGTGLWSTDGTSVTRLSQGPVASGSLAPLGAGRVLFASRSAVGEEPWISDGTPAGTSLLVDLARGPATRSSSPRAFAGLGAEAVFTDDGSVWSTDGTAAGTRNLGPTVGATMLGVVGRRAVYADNIVNPVLTACDGRQCVTIARAPGTVLPLAAAAGDLLVLTQLNPSEVLVTDGTTAGLRSLGDLSGGTELLIIRSAAQLGPARYLLQAGARLFASDGSAAGTQALPSLPAATWTMSDAYDGRVLLQGFDVSGPVAMWLSDGTAAGTRSTGRVARVAFATDRGLFFVDANDQLHAYDGATGLARPLGAIPTGEWTFVLHQSDRAVLRARDRVLRVDTRTGTHREFAAFGTPTMAAIGEHLILVDSALRLLHVDGQDNLRGVIGPVRAWVVAGGRVLFAHQGGPQGEELWSYDPGASAVSLAGGCSGGSRLPTLSTGAPRIGRVLQLTGEGVAASARVAALWLGTVRFPAQPLSSGCLLTADPTVTLVRSVIGGLPFAFLVDVPNVAALVGVRLAAQALWGPTDAPLGADVSNGVLLSVGR